jgi:hypothetical protein
MLSETTRLSIELICVRTIGTHFAALENPMYRGQHHTWSKFPERMFHECQTQCKLNANLEMTGHVKEVEQYVSHVVNEYSSLLLEYSGHWEADEHS